jgi:hypothetical protein
LPDSVISGGYIPVKAIHHNIVYCRYFALVAADEVNRDKQDNDNGG